MLGAIIGDLAGSIYEFDQYKKVKKIIVSNLIEDDAFFSDDTILTIAIIDAILNKKNYTTKLKEYALKYSNDVPKEKQYFQTMFSPNFIKWANGKNVVGKSNGNGAMMRISPIGYLFDKKRQIIKNVKLATKPSHNTREAIKSATIIALIIYYARLGMSKEKIIKKLHLKIKKPVVEKFNYTCNSTIDVCLYSLFTTNSFEESLKTAISFGGDTDTNACIVGSVAEAIYGISDNLKQIAISKLPNNFVEILREAYHNIKVIKKY